MIECWEPRRLLLGLACLAALMTGSASARDLGVQGTTYEIIERDFRAEILASASKADWASVQDQAKASAERYLDSLPKRVFETASELTIQYVDPRITLEADIKVPRKQADGSFQWEVLYAKGERFNPLTQHRPTAAMLFFDGSNEAQISFVMESLKAHPFRLTPVDVSGANPEKLSRRIGRPVFAVNDFMLQRVPIRYAPSLLFPGQGAQALLLGVASFASPYDPQVIEQVWPSTIGVPRAQ